MNVPFYIAKRIINNQNQSFSKLIIKIAIVAISLGMTIMIVASSLISGFQEEISGKLFGFMGHIHVMDFEAVRSNSYESSPVSTKQDFYPSLDTIRQIRYPKTTNFLGIEDADNPREAFTKGGVSHIQTFAQKMGVINTKDEIEGILLKGVGRDFDWKYMDDFIQEGERLTMSDTVSSRNILLSEYTAKRMQLKVGDKMRIYFPTKNSRTQRRFQVKGIYKTGLQEYDSKFAIVDIREIQKLYKWDSTQVSGFEIFIDDLDDLEPISSHIYDILPMNLYSSNIKNMEPNIFGWLKMQDVTEVVILLLMLIVGMINMVTALIILILERTNMIGTLKSIGAKNNTVQQIFLYYGAYITLVGLIIGNVIGLGLCYAQLHFGFITLPEEDYYVSVAPISIDYRMIFFLNVGTLILTVIILIIPSFLVRYISPVKAIRFS